MAEGTCFLCGNYETVERHHLFSGALRHKADKLKLTVMLCPWCHQYDADSAHRSAETRRYLHKYGQMKAMREQGWSVEDFIREFGRNYLDEDEIEEVEHQQRLDQGIEPYAEVNSFRVIEGAELPW